MKRLLATAATLVALALSGCLGETEPATNVTPTTATLNGKGSCVQGEVGEWWYRYRTTDPVGAWQVTPRTPFVCARDEQDIATPKDVSGLQVNRSYEFNLVGRERDGSGNWDTPWYCGQTTDTCQQGANPLRPWDAFDTDVAFKGVQVPADASRRPTMAELDAANVGSVRIISSDYTEAGWDTLEEYAAQLRSIGVFPIIGMDMQPGLTAAAWADRVQRWASSIPSAGVLELGNEEGSEFTYPGTAARTDWNGYFDAVEDAAPIVRAQGGTPVMGSARDVYEASRLTKAQARWGTAASAWPTPDGVAIHPYGSASPWTRAAALNTTVGRLDAARARVPQGIPLWITEVGWGVDGNVESQLVLLGGAGTLADREAEQSGIVSDLYRLRLWPRVNAADLNVANVGYFMWRDLANPTLWWHYAGLHDAQGLARPALSTFSGIASWKPR